MIALLKRGLAVALFLLAGALPVAAQQVANHAIPIGRGPGVVGFNSIAAAANTKFLVGGGTSADPVMQTMSGDCTLAAGVVTCTKTNNVSFAAIATSGSASDLSTGTLPNARLDAEVQCVAGLTSAADKITYYTGSGTCALGDFGSAVRTFNTTSSSANLRALLTDETGTGIAYFVGGALGTPSSATLTNATGLPVAGITSSTSTALGVGSLEIGAASDTTLERVSAGVASIEGSNILTAATGQPLDSDLTTIAGLTATTDNFLQAKSSAWASRTPTQVTADLIAFVGDSGSGGTKGLVPAPASGDSGKFLRGDGTWVTIAGGGDMLASNNLSDLANKATSRTNLGVAIGTNVQAWDTDLDAFAGVSSTGLIARTGSGTASARTITAGTGISVSNGDGVSGNPTISLSGTNATMAVFRPANDEPPSSNYATLDTRNGHPVLEFDTTTGESAIFTGLLPCTYSGSGLIVYVHAAADTATSGTIGWTVAIERMDDGTTDFDSDSFASAQTITAATVPGTSGVSMVGNVSISSGANMDSLAACEMFRLKLTRDVANDNAAGDAQLLEVLVKDAA